MAEPALRARLRGWLPAVLSDAESGQDAVKWVGFARKVFGLMLVSVVTVAGITAVVSTKQAEGLLTESLSAQGRAIADALARAAFVPLTLEDEATLRSLLDAYRGIDNVAGVRVMAADRRVLHEVARTSSKTGLVRVQAPILPIADREAPEGPVGFIEVDMWSERIQAKSWTIALVNVLISGALTIMISAAGFLMIRKLVARMHALVGEARLVEEVKRANAELEAFSYSVSHDLRAPLRGIAGFAQIVLEDSAAALDEAGKENLGRVVSATKLMGTLIDDMLELSRVSRTEMQPKRVDLSELARKVISELREREPSRLVETVVTDRLSARGDPQLLRIALVNLIGNAWKYTGQKAEALIEFGASLDEKRGMVFFVRDNGAGFDMAYSGKLFAAFQRLHAQAEFEGTGVGLATVQRIIRRHGGQIWAQAAVGQGATFYFTL